MYLSHLSRDAVRIVIIELVDGVVTALQELHQFGLAHQDILKI